MKNHKTIVFSFLNKVIFSNKLIYSQSQFIQESIENTERRAII